MKITFNAALPSIRQNNTTNNVLPFRFNYPKIQNDSFVKSDVSFAGLSAVATKRLKYIPRIPEILQNVAKLTTRAGEATSAVGNFETIAQHFPKTYGRPTLTLTRLGDTAMQSTEPLNVGVIFSGGPASGGHNVVSGLFDAIKQIHPDSRLHGFKGGPDGLIKDISRELDEKSIKRFRNQGGFDLIGTGRTKLEKEEQFEQVLANCKRKGINSIVVIGGDDSNTNAAMLAEWLAKKGENISVVGVPKTIDGDLKTAQIRTSFGFDTATKTYSEIVGNIERDAASAKKYWHFIKMMGRSASHVTLEVGHQTRPNITLISEEVAAKNMSLDDVVTHMASVISKRAQKGKNYGVALIPEGLLEFVPEMGRLIDKLNRMMPDLQGNTKFNTGNIEEKAQLALANLGHGTQEAKLFDSLPAEIKDQLLAPRDSHGNLLVSQIDTDKLLLSMVKTKLSEMKKAGKYDGKFASISHFLGYEGRSGLPSRFDADYCYALGKTAAALIKNKATGYMAAVDQLHKHPRNWTPEGVPITSMMQVESRSGKDKPVIRKALVELEGPVFKEFARLRDSWAINDRYVYQAPMQLDDPSVTKTLKLESR